MHTLYTVPHRYHVPPVDGGVFCVLLRGFVGACLRCSLGMVYTVCRKRVYTIITVAVIYTDIRFCTSDLQMHV